jgi:hypothetical protein
LTQPTVVESIRALPASWHQSGSLNIAVVDYLFRCAQGAQNTAETGCGKSTLALSHASQRHVAFTLGLLPGEDPKRHSFSQVKSSPLLRQETCEFVLGPTQQTVPAFPFDRQFDLVLLDGPHGYPFPELEYFYFYPHILPGGWLVVDDIQIPTIANMVSVLKRDAMFRLERVVRTTAFFRRTDAPTFPPLGDGWWEQGYNQGLGVSIRHVAFASAPRVIAGNLLRRFAKR